MDYITEYNVFMYNQNKAMAQTKFEFYISECMVLAEGQDVVNRIRSLHEAEDKTIGGFFKKIWEFIKRIWAKFIDKMTRLISGNKKWLDKNRAIILNNPFKFESITIYNYPVGVDRIVKGKLPAFDFDKLDQGGHLADDKITYEYVADQIGYKGYKYNDDDDSSFSTDMKEYFWGGAEQVEIPKSKVNLTDMFNYCYEYEKMKDIIVKDKDALEKAIESMNKIVTNKAIKSTADSDTKTTGDKTDDPKPVIDPKSTDNNAASDTSTSGGNEPKQGESGDSNQGATESAIFSNVYGAIITEADKAAVNGDPDHDIGKDDTVRKASSSTGVYGNKTATAKANVSNVDKDDTAGERNTNRANAASGAEAAEMQKKCTRYNNAASGVLSAKLSAAEQCYKDYLRIMIAHVDSYTGRKQTNSKVADAATDYSGKLSQEDETKVNNFLQNNAEVKNAANDAAIKDLASKQFGNNDALINRAVELWKAQRTNK